MAPDMPGPEAQNQPSADEIAEALTGPIHGQLRAMLDPRPYRTPATRLVLNGAPVLSIQVLRALAPGPAQTSAAPIMAWRTIAPLQAVFYQMLANTPQVRRCVQMGSSLLPFYAVLAAEWAARLARQMGAQSEIAIDVSRKPPDFESSLSACHAGGAGSSSLLHATAAEMLEALRNPEHPQPSIPSGPPPAKLLVSVVDGALCVRGFSPEDQELWAEPADVLLRRLAACAARFLATHAASEAKRREAHREAGERALQAICPRLARAAALAQGSDHAVGLRVCRGAVRGMPAEAWVYLDAATEAQEAFQDSPQVTLEVRRAHEEFILGNSGNQLFYYPPCQLVARVVFSPQDPGLWHVERPRVRAPQGSAQWVHPYVGPLQETRLSRALVLGDSRDDCSMPASPEGAAIVPAVVPHARLGVENDMCLTDQDAVVDAADNALRSAVAAGAEPDILRWVRELWDVARLGLTRGHQGNNRTPRASLCPGVGRYLVADPSLLGPRLASRIFPYEPGPPVAAAP